MAIFGLVHGFSFGSATINILVLILILMKAKFPQILSKIKQVTKYTYFTKNYMAELKFMEVAIRSDAKRSEKIRNPLSWMGDANKQVEMIEQLAHKYNPKFCLAFQMMSVEERQDYLLQLLEMIGQLNREIEQIKENPSAIRGKNPKKSRDKKEIKKQLYTKLFQTYIGKDKAEKWERSLIGSSTFFVNSQVDGSASEKMIKFDKYLIHFVSKTRKEESKLILDIRNYLILGGQYRPYSLRMQSIYYTIQPNIVQIQFIDSFYQEEIIQYLTKVSAIGKIQNMIRNLQIGQIEGLVETNLSKNKSGILSTVLLLPNQDSDIQQGSEEQSLFSIKTLYPNSKMPSQQLKIQQLQDKRYEEAKRNLIQTLHQLADKKITQNKKIDAFLKKNLAIHGKLKSEALKRALQSKQALLYQNKKSFQFSVRPKQSLTRTENSNQEIIKDQGFFKIIGRKYGQKDVEDQKNESFVSKDGVFRQKDFKGSFCMISKRSRPILYKDNIYSQLYPAKKIIRNDYLKDYDQLEIQNKIWQYPEIKALNLNTNNIQKSSLPEKNLTTTQKNPQSENLKVEKSNLTEKNAQGDKNGKPQKNSKLKKKSPKNQQTKFNWFQEITRDCRLYQFKLKKSKLKILIKIPIQLGYLISSVADITSWSKWHPNIKQVKLVQRIKQKNIYSFQMLCKVGKSEFKYNLQSHFFRIQNNCFIAMKSFSTKKQNTNQGSFWNPFRFWKSEEERSLNYLLFKMQKSGANLESSKIVIELQIDQKLYQKKNASFKEQVTVFLNFYFIFMYCQNLKSQLSTNLAHDLKTQTDILDGKRLLNHDIFQIDWQVESSKLIEDYYIWSAE